MLSEINHFKVQYNSIILISSGVTLLHELKKKKEVQINNYDKNFLCILKRRILRTEITSKL